MEEVEKNRPVRALPPDAQEVGHKEEATYGAKSGTWHCDYKHNSDTVITQLKSFLCHNDQCQQIGLQTSQYHYRCQLPNVGITVDPR